MAAFWPGPARATRGTSPCQWGGGGKWPTSRYRILEIFMIFMEGRSLLPCQSWFSSTWKIRVSLGRKMERKFSWSSPWTVLIQLLSDGFMGIFQVWFNTLEFSSITKHIFYFRQRSRKSLARKGQKWIFSGERISRTSRKLCPVGEIRGQSDACHDQVSICWPK